MAAKSGVKDQQSVLKIVISLMFVAMGVEGFVKGKSGQAIGHLYTFVADLFGKAGDSFVIIVGAVIFLAGLCVLASMFIKQIPGKVVTVSMIILMVIWALTIIFADFVDGFGDINDFVSFMVWLETFLVHVIVLSATVSAYGGALRG
ncbi:MAG: hypothetical protein LKJ89_04210 [Sphaerochaeta sp.]|jgi:hypothetical protein|nr:hypothetical protein [Sphaerochaeta sp.]MCI2096353.1 hypothetical protein [Sphaerochaeta sp.]MCI2104267.1 hypothetical protein [Sphaerochaeta sp.]